MLFVKLKHKESVGSELLAIVISYLINLNKLHPSWSKYQVLSVLGSPALHLYKLSQAFNYFLIIILFFFLFALETEHINQLLSMTFQQWFDALNFL